MIKKILVTGSSGTIGTRLCETLLAKGYDVVGADWKPNHWNEAVQKITTIVDLRDEAATLEKLPKDVDLIIHLAANARVWELVVDPDRARDNILTIFNTLEHARKAGIKRFMFSSSREVYGNLDQPVHSEADASIDACEGPYTASKIAGEALVWAYQRCYGIDGLVFRFSNVYGMYDEAYRLVPLFINKIAKGEPITVFGEHKMLDFTYVDDTVGAVIKAIEGFDALKGDVYNIAYGEGTKLVDVAGMINEEMGGNGKIVIGESRIGEVIQYVADIAKAKKNMGYEPKVPVREGIRRAVAWYKKFWNL